MRVYLPSTLPALVRALESRTLPPGPAHAVTPALREWYTGGNEEELEYAALTAAARTSLALLADDPSAPPRRVVLSAEVPDGSVRAVGGPYDDARADVTLTEPVTWKQLTSAHLDEETAAEDVRAAVAALPAARAGDDDARFTVDTAESHDLLWYAIQELQHVL